MSSESDSLSGTASKPNDSPDIDTAESNLSLEDIGARLSDVEEELSDDGAVSGKTAEDVDDKSPAFVWRQYEEHWKNGNKALSGLQPCRSAWNQFTEWMESMDYEHLADLSGAFSARHDDWIVSHEDYQKNALSRNMHLSRIRAVIEFAKDRNWVSSEAVPDDDEWARIKPDVGDDEKVRSDPLRPERGEVIMEWVAENKPFSRAHVLWLLLFRYGFRVSAVRALDCEDLVVTEPDDWPEEQDFYSHLNLKDRPEIGLDSDTGLPLKNTRDELADRRVPLQEEDAEVLYRYVYAGSPQGAKTTRKEHDEPDGYGLHGLLTSEHKPRLSARTIRDRCHWLTCPTTYADECECNGCREYRAENGGDNPMPSKIGTYCEKTRSPHQVRHGAITRLLDDHDHTTVAQVVGTSPDTLRNVYDRADEYRRLNRTADAWM